MTKQLFLTIVVLFFTAHSFAKKKELTLDVVWASRTFASESIYGVNSMNDGRFYSSQVRNTGINEIVKFNYADGEQVEVVLGKDQLVPEGATKPINFGSYSFNEDETMILLSTEEESIYRHSSRANYFIYNRASKSLVALSQKGKQMNPAISPNGKLVSFVRDNNIFIKNLADGVEMQLTNDGVSNAIINGATDWVYEEELSSSRIAFTRAHFWSPDSKKILYLKFNETKVPEFLMQYYEDLYPSEYRFKYPKAGEANSEVSLWLCDLTTAKHLQINTGDNKDIYIPRLGWTKEANTCYFMRLNRHQNQLDLIFTNSTTLENETILSETNKYYIELFDAFTFLKKGDKFIWDSERSGYNHLYLVDVKSKSMTPITSGNYDVTDFFGVDEEKGLVYYESAEVSPMQRHVYVSSFNKRKKQQLTTKEGTNSASFSNDFSYFLNFHTSANAPMTVTLHNTKGDEIRVVKENPKIVQSMEDYGFVKKEFFNFTTSKGIVLNGWMMKPADFDPTKTYPVFMWVYGGPGSQQVTDSWGGSNFIWYQMLTQKGYIVACIDNRGTGARGEEFKKCTYLDLGKLEVEDQIEAAQYLGGLPYIDAARVGIMGWSYGGYMSSLCISKGSDVFKLAVAVAPVTNWRFYDTIYTERYLRTPQENEKGYDQNSPVNFVDRIKGKYLIIHGTADDNVHFQNSVMMVDAMVKQDIAFDSEFYPNRNHGIYGGKTRLQLFSKITDFVVTNL